MNANVNVAVRVRPLMGREISINRRCVSYEAQENVLAVGDKKFSFCSVFGEQSTQNEVYDSCVQPLIEGCFQGFNATVFAYGQTGSGKTHSIMGGLTFGLPAIAEDFSDEDSLQQHQQQQAKEASEPDDSAGIIPRAIRDIFRGVREERAAGRVANVRVSMVEIYNDDCRDLLHPDIPAKDIVIREDRDGRIFLTGAREEAVRDSEQALLYLQQGNLNRSTAETLMNQSSSRSHAIFTVAVEVLDYQQVAGAASKGSKTNGSFTQAKLHLVDLAGSERAKRTGALGTRLKESVGINQGLLSLGKVIRALTSHPISHVPYRESKLTRFLQDSLGGNSRTVMLACISSADSNLHETLSTLQYASRAKAVQNKVSANIALGVIPALPESELQSDMESSIVLTLRAQLEQMQADMLEMKNKDFIDNDGGSNNSSNSSRQGHQIFSESTAAVAATATGATNSALGDNALQHMSQGSLSRITQALHTVSSTLSQHLEQVDPIFSRHNSSGSNNHSNNFENNNSNGSYDELQPADVQSCRALVDACRGMRSMLDSLQPITGSSSNSYSNNNNSINNNGNNNSVLRDSLRESLHSLEGGARFAQNHEQEIESLRQELEECREDLKRDEDIFAEKIKELKKCKRQIKELEAENKKISDEQSTMQVQVKKLTGALMRQKKQFSTLQLKAAETVCAGKQPLTPAAITSTNRSAIKSSSNDGNNSFTVDEDDELNISLAVAMTEPDISQLMEDLEALAREKADLEMGSQIAEEKMQSIASNSQIEIEELAQQRLQLLSQIERLEKQLECSEQQVTALQHEKRDIATDYSKQQQQLEAAEAECDRLHAQLKLVGSEKYQSVVEYDEERERRRQLERQLRDAEDQLQQVESQQKERAEDQRLSQLEAKQLEDAHLQELETLRAEQLRLKDQMRESENRQKSTLEQLSAQVAQYKKRAVEALKKVMSVEETNEKLQARAAAEAAAAESSLPNSTSTQSKGVQATVPTEDCSWELSQEDRRQLEELLSSRVDEIFEVKSAARLLERHRSSLLELENERSAVQKELWLLMKPEGRQAEVLRLKVADIDQKTSALQQKAAGIRKALDSIHSEHDSSAVLDALADTVVVPSPAKVQSLHQEMHSIEGALSSYQQHRAEIIDRLRSLLRRAAEAADEETTPQHVQKAIAVADSDTASRLLGLQEEAESIDMEIETVRGQIETSEKQLAKLQFVNGSSSKSSASGSGSSCKYDESTRIDTIVRAAIDQFKADRSSVAAGGLTPSAEFKAVAGVLLRMLSEERWQVQNSEASLKQLQQQLENKASEYDEVVQAMQKTRRDSMRRLEQQAKESEEKIAFLLQQLRSAEAARRSLEASASAATSVVGTPNFNSAPLSSEGFSASSGSRIGTPAAEAFLNYANSRQPLSSRK